MRFSSRRSLIVSLAFALWVIGRPFAGIWHDSRFYSLQALQHLRPIAFSRDLFFLYGSQDQYSLFGSFHAFAIAISGLMTGTMALQGIGLGLWFGAAWALMRCAPGKLAPIALVLLVSIDSHYGSHGVFAFGEQFLTARLYAEAFSLLGLAAWLAGNKALGGAAFAVACTLHPVMALPALVVGLGMLLRPKVWFGLVGTVVAMAIGLGFMGLPPFTGLLHPMDAVWWQLAVARSPFVFLHTWEWEGFSQALFVTVVAGTAWRTLSDEKLSRLAWVTLVCVLGAFSIAYLGGSLLKLPLIAGLQLTRIIWIGLVITVMLIVAMVGESHQATIWTRMRAWGLALALFLDAATQGGYALIVLAIFGVGERYLPAYKPPLWFWLLLGLIPLQIMLWGMLGAHMDAEMAVLMSEESVWREYLLNPATSLLLVLAAFRLHGREQLSKMWKGLAGVAIPGLLVLAIVTWSDVLPELDYDSSARRAAIAPIATRVPEGATVYWVDEPDKAWFWLGRANYVSFSQTAGTVFSRGTAIEARRRAAYARAASLSDASQTWDDRRSIAPAQYVSSAAVRQACRDPVLDYVIGRSGPIANGIYFLDPATSRGYRLYDCRVAREGDTTVSGSSAVDIQIQNNRHL